MKVHFPFISAAEKTEISLISVYFQFKRAAEKTEILTDFN